MTWLALLMQLSATSASGWERVGIVGLLVTGITIVGLAFQMEWVVPGGRYKEKTAECEKLREDNMRLWAEKVEDAKESEMVAKAYIRIRESDRNAP